MVRMNGLFQCKSPPPPPPSHLFPLLFLLLFLLLRYIWNDDGDTAILRDASGNEVSRLACIPQLIATRTFGDGDDVRSQGSGSSGSSGSSGV